MNEKFNESFSEVFAKKRIRGLISLRRLQFRLAERNAAMAIFLGNNYLGQKDRQEIDQNSQGQIIFIDDVRE